MTESDSKCDGFKRLFVPFRMSSSISTFSFPSISTFSGILLIPCHCRRDRCKTTTENFVLSLLNCILRNIFSIQRFPEMLSVQLSSFIVAFVFVSRTWKLKCEEVRKSRCMGISHFSPVRRRQPSLNKLTWFFHPQILNFHVYLHQLTPFLHHFLCFLNQEVEGKHCDTNDDPLRTTSVSKSERTRSKSN